MAAVVITVTPLLLPPVAVADVIGGINPGDPETVINVLGNDLVTSGLSTTLFPGVPSNTTTPPTPIKVLPAGSAGSLSLSTDGKTLGHTPGSSAITDFGIVTFSYVVRDTKVAESLPTLVTLYFGVPIPTP